MSDLNKQNYLERAKLLLKQKRYKDAEQQAGIILKSHPDDADALQVIGHCRLDTKQFSEAIRLFQQCISIEPDNDYVFYLLAFANYQIKNKDEAVANLNRAIQLNPYAAGYYGLYAYIMLEMKWYDEALERANRGLAVNAEDLTCLNARSAALFKLKNKTEAYQTIREALTVDPENDFTHTNYAWHFLEQGEHKKAREHFREALRINPDNSRARKGYKESLKANLPPYRWMLMFSLWLSSKSKKARWAIIIVIWLSVRLISGVSDTAGLGIVAYVVIGLYLLFVIFSWVGTPLANIMLLLNKEGKYILTKREKYIASGVCICILSAILIACFGNRLPAVKDDEQYFAALIIVSITLPLSRFEYIDGVKKYKLAYLYTILLTAFGMIAGIGLIIYGKDMYLPGFIYLAALAIYTWSFAFTKG